VKNGEFLVVVGESGSGKTTLLKLINRLVEPSAGEIRVGGRDAKALDPIQLRRSIGYVFQEVGLFPHLTIAENIAITPRLLGWDKSSIAERVRGFQLVRLPQDLADRFPATLSGGRASGSRRRSAPRRAPEIVLMDEPFGAVDAITRESLAERLPRCTIGSS
jgi:osmoprotectant transport system ATP-binding protein